MATANSITIPSHTTGVRATFSIGVAASNDYPAAYSTVDTSAALATIPAIVEAEESSIQAYHALVPKGTWEEEEAEEREWRHIVSHPHVRQALRRMATEARRQYYAGETEQGGFGGE